MNVAVLPWRIFKTNLIANLGFNLLKEIVLLLSSPIMNKVIIIAQNSSYMKKARAASDSRSLTNDDPRSWLHDGCDNNTTGLVSAHPQIDQT